MTRRNEGWERSVRIDGERGSDDMKEGRVKGR